MLKKNRPQFRPHFYLANALGSIMASLDPVVTVRELAKDIGVTAQSISRVLTQNLGTFDDSTLEGIVKSLGLSEKELDRLRYLSELDSFESRFGGILTVEKTKIPAEVSFAWDQLNQAQRNKVTDQINIFVSENLKKRR